METPSSTTRVTRSQTLAASANNTNLLSSRKFEESEKGMTKSRKKKNGQKQEGAALIDITNDSPIVGLAMGNLKSPSSAMSKKRGKVVVVPRTPGSGEALLRGQVKTLLQKVEEEASELSKITLMRPPLFNSPIMNLVVAPTPANTPQILSDHTADDKFLIPQMMMISEVLDEKNEELEIENLMITRSLLLDFSEKACECDSSSSSSSVVTHEGAFCSSRGKLDDDDAISSSSSSVWSIQVNASSTTTRDNDDDPEEEEEEEEEEEDLGGDGQQQEVVVRMLLDEVCEGMSNISVKEDKFMGKHIRFVYNSDDDDDDDEIEGGEEKVFL